MKKYLLFVLSFLLCFCTLCFCACSTPEEKQTITGITFASAIFDYDGTLKSITIDGDLPSSVTVSYENNSQINAGVYNAKATVSGKGYHTLTLTATLTINKIDITGVSVEENQEAKHSGENLLPKITGTLPNGVTAKYFLNDNEISGVKAVGNYDIKIVLSGNNYNEKIFNCAFKVKLNLTNLAQTVIETFGSTPDPWSFLPESFSSENKQLSNAPTYETFTQTSSLPTNGIGKQLSVAYDLLNKTQKALTYVQPVYSVLNTIKTLYTEFLDNNPENYKSFSSTVAGITFSITLTESQYLLSATVKSVQLVIFSDTETHTYGAKVQLANNTAVKYTVGENNLLIAMDVLDTLAVQIEFVREEEQVLGYMYEYIVAGDKTLTATSTMILVDTTYTTLIGTKGDFIPTAVSRNCEVYLNSTGELVGTEVREELTISGMTATYNTLWYTLNDVSGINSIKKVDEMNGTNADTIYINGSNDTIHTKLVGILGGKKAASRRFDIEFKTMYFYNYNTEKEEYEKVSCEVPMLFVQEEYADTFEEDFENANESSLTQNVIINVSNNDKTAINYGYYTLLQAYDIIKDKVSFDNITEYCKK